MLRILIPITAILAVAYLAGKSVVDSLKFELVGVDIAPGNIFSNTTKKIGTVTFSINNTSNVPLYASEAYLVMQMDNRPLASMHITEPVTLHALTTTFITADIYASSLEIIQSLLQLATTGIDKVIQLTGWLRVGPGYLNFSEAIPFSQIKTFA